MGKAATRLQHVHYRAIFAELLEVAEEPAMPRTARARDDEPVRRGSFLHPGRAMASDEAAAREREHRSER